MEPIELFHASPVAGIALFRELSHFGTREAALQRATLWDAAFLYRVALTGQRILRVPDFSPADDRGAVHSWMRLTDQLHYDVRPRALSSENRNAVFDAGVLSSEGGATRFDDGLAGACLAGLLLKRWDLLAYENKVEDPGSLAFILLDPACVKILSVQPIRSLESPRRPAFRPG